MALITCIGRLAGEVWNKVTNTLRIGLQGRIKVGDDRTLNSCGLVTIFPRSEWTKGSVADGVMEKQFLLVVVIKLRRSHVV